MLTVQFKGLFYNLRKDMLRPVLYERPQHRPCSGLQAGQEPVPL
jgi:hypothetical protein